MDSGPAVAPAPGEIDHGSLVRALLADGLLDAADIHAGVRVTGVTRRHQVWSVRVASGGSLIVKQALTADGWIALTREAMLYERLSTPGCAIAAALPRCIRYDETRRLLVLEYIDGRSLVDDVAGKRQPSSRSAATFGQLIASLHRNRPDWLDETAPPALTRWRQEEDPHRSHASLPEIPSVASAPVPPWVLDVHRPTLATFHQSSEASLQLRSAIQQSPVIGPAFDALRDEWQPAALVHGDLKLHHVLISKHKRQIAIVDWEAATAGDPAWDVGTVIAGYLTVWLRSIPLVAGVPNGQFMQHAAVPIERVQQALRAFWDGYAAETDGTEAILQRSMRYAAARLIQLEDERLHGEPAAGRRTELIVGVCENILRAPERAATVLAGLNPDRAAGQ